MYDYCSLLYSRSGPATECFMFHARAAETKMRYNLEVILFSYLIAYQAEKITSWKFFCI